LSWLCRSASVVATVGTMKNKKHRTSHVQLWQPGIAVQQRTGCLNPDLDDDTFFTGISEKLAWKDRPVLIERYGDLKFLFYQIS
jgi:hypothetical protein